MTTFNPEKVLLQNAKTGEIPSEIGTLVLKEVANNSLVAKLGTYEPMDKMEKKFTYLAEGPGAYWVEEAEKIQVDKATWLQATMKAHKLGVIVPVSKEYLKFTVSDFFNAIKPHIEEALRNKMDQAVFFGSDDSPFGTGASIVEKANTAGNKLEKTADLYGDLNKLMALVEASDNDPKAFVTTKALNVDLRGALDKNGRPIFTEATQGAAATALGLPVLYGNKNVWDKKKAEIITGDFTKLRYGMPAGIEYSISEDATLSTVVDEEQKPIHLFERDMVALRVTAYFGFMTLKDDAFAVITPKAGA
ncbi:MAG: phage major capsid protein [Ezakiella sp.]|nr:phage major capsid protein [Ezakiella sp.]